LLDAGVVFDARLTLLCCVCGGKAALCRWFHRKITLQWPWLLGMLHRACQGPCHLPSS